METRKESQLAAERDPLLIAEFWDPQLASLERLVKSAAPYQAKRNGFIDPTIRPAAGWINILALSQMADFCGLGASKWTGQCAVGFPITGDLSQAKAFPRKNPSAPLLRKKQLLDSAVARFREGSPKSGWGKCGRLTEGILGPSFNGLARGASNTGLFRKTGRLTCGRL